MLNVYGPSGQRLDTEDVPPETYGPGKGCEHRTVVTVEDNSGIEGVEARQCRDCLTGWLIKVNMQGEQT